MLHWHWQKTGKNERQISPVILGEQGQSQHGILCLQNHSEVTSDKYVPYGWHIHCIQCVLWKPDAAMSFAHSSVNIKHKTTVLLWNTTKRRVACIYCLYFIFFFKATVDDSVQLQFTSKKNALASPTNRKLRLKSASFSLVHSTQQFSDQSPSQWSAWGALTNLILLSMRPLSPTVAVLSCCQLESPSPCGRNPERRLPSESACTVGLSGVARNNSSTLHGSKSVDLTLNTLESSRDKLRI